MAKRTLGYLSAAPRVSTDPYADMGGARTHVLGIVDGFSALGWQVRQFIVGDYIPRSWVSHRSANAHSGSRLRLLLNDIIRIVLGLINPFIALLIIRTDIEMVYERFATLQSLGWIFKAFGIPWFLETNAPLFYEADVERGSTALPRLAKRMEGWAYRRCDRLICVSEELKAIIIRDLGIDAGKVTVLPNAADPRTFAPESIKPVRCFEPFTIGFVGTLYSWQGLRMLLAAVNQLRQEDLDICITLVGDGPERSSLEAQVRQLGLDTCVKFIGQVPWHDIPAYNAGFDVAYSGQIALQIGSMYLSPLKLYEYMAMAKPVIASAFADARTLIQDGLSGFLFEPGSIPDLKRALRQAHQLHQEASLAAVGRAAREGIIAHHTWEHRVRQLIDILDHRAQRDESGP